MRRFIDFQSAYGYSNKSACYEVELVAGKPFGLVVWANGDEEIFSSTSNATEAMNAAYQELGGGR